MANIAKIELGDTTYDIKDAVVRPKIDAITAEDTDGNTYVQTSQLTVDGNSNLNGVVTANAIAIKGPRDSNTSAFTIKSENIDRDTTETISETQWGSKFRFLDNDNESIGYIEPFQRPSGTTGLRIISWNEKSDESTAWNGLTLEVAKDGTASYSVSNPANFCSAIDALPLTGGTLTGDLTVNKSIIVSGNSATKNSSINRDGSNPSSDMWTNGRGFLDKDGEWLGYLQAFQRTNGTTGIQIRALTENSSGSEVENFIRVAVDKNGTKSYQVGDATAFRTAINAAENKDYAYSNASQHPWFWNPGGSTQIWGVSATCQRSTNTSFYNKQIGLVVENTRLHCFNHTDNTAVWTAYTDKNKPTPADIGAASTNADGAINTLASTADQQWLVRGKINNSSNSINGHYTWLVMNNSGLSCWDATAQKTLWTTYTEKNSPSSTTTLTNIGTLERYGPLRVLRVMTTNAVNLSGSWTELQVGSALAASDRPTVNIYSTGIADDTGGLGVGLLVQTDGKFIVRGRGGTPIGNHKVSGELCWIIV